MRRQTYDRRITQLSERMYAMWPDDKESLRTLALAEKKRGALYGVTGRLEEARKKYLRAAALT